MDVVQITALGTYSWYCYNCMIFYSFISNLSLSFISNTWFFM